MTPRIRNQRSDAARTELRPALVEFDEVELAVLALCMPTCIGPAVQAIPPALPECLGVDSDHPCSARSAMASGNPHSTRGTEADGIDTGTTAGRSSRARPH